MAKRKEKYESEWQTLIKAQDETSKILIKQEDEIIKQAKVKYKELLDRQLKEKNKALRNENDIKRNERKFYEEQEKAASRTEKEKKDSERFYEKAFCAANKSEEAMRKKMSLLEMKNSKEIEQMRLRNIKEFEEKRNNYELLVKNKIIEEQKSILERQIEEKQRQVEIRLKEREVDKAMIEKNIEEMKVKEQSYKISYDRRMEAIERKKKLFQPVIDKNNDYQDLINKRYEQWELSTKEKALKKEQEIETNKAKATVNIRNELEKQIDLKRQMRMKEIQESIKEKNEAARKANEETIQNNLKSLENKRKMEELRIFLDHQLHEKEKSLNNIYMDPIERKMNRQVLESVTDNKVASFPGIPGVNTTDSPLKFSMNRHFDTKQVAKPFSLNMSYDSSQRDFSSPPNYHQVNKSFRDLGRHDPIINPIGSFIPRVLPGQRIARGAHSISTFGRMGNNIINFS